MDTIFASALAAHDGSQPSPPSPVGPSPVGEGSALELDHARLDLLERRMLDQGAPVHAPVVHRFGPGWYVRTIEMPPGMILTSRVHRTEHPYAVLSGFASVLVVGEAPVLLAAGHLGVTRAGTRRALLIGTVGEDGQAIPAPGPCRWSTFHVLSPEEDAARAAGATTEDMVSMIEARIIEPHLHLDGVDAHQEYIAALGALGLPGPHDGPRALEGG